MSAIGQLRMPRVLIADSAPMIRMTLRACLEDAGYEVQEAVDGWDMLEELGHFAPDLLVADACLPGPDGIAIAQSPPDCAWDFTDRTIWLAGDDRFDTVVAWIHRQHAALLRKPVPAALFLLLVQRTLGICRKESLFPRSIGYAWALSQVRKALRTGELDEAEELLMRAGVIADREPEFLNLLGVWHECRGRLNIAKRCYGRAIKSDPDYAPAQMTMQRAFELAVFGRTSKQIWLGDEPDACDYGPYPVRQRLRRWKAWAISKLALHTLCQ